MPYNTSSSFTKRFHKLLANLINPPWTWEVLAIINQWQFSVVCVSHIRNIQYKTKYTTHLCLWHPQCTISSFVKRLYSVSNFKNELVCYTHQLFFFQCSHKLNLSFWISMFLVLFLHEIIDCSWWLKDSRGIFQYIYS